MNTFANLGMDSHDNTESVTNWNTYATYFSIPMSYEISCLSNNQIYQAKTDITMAMAVRFGFVSALVLTKLFRISRHKVTEFLNKQINKGLLVKVKTQRAPDGVIYVPTYSGVKFFEERYRLNVPFRSTANPIQQVNQNQIFHDTILQYVLVAMNNRDKPFLSGFVTETEFKRLYPSASIKNVDAVCLNLDGSVAAIEIENSFKRKAQHKATLLKLLPSLKGANRLFDKVFFVSSSHKTMNDTKRFHQELLDELPGQYNRKTKTSELTLEDAELLRQKLIYRTKFTDELDETFYS